MLFTEQKYMHALQGSVVSQANGCYDVILNRRAPEQKYFLPKRKKIGQEQLDDIPLHDETRFKCFPTKAYTVQNFIKFTQSMLLTT